MLEVHVNFPNEAEADSVAHGAVEQRLAAGANIHPPIRSHYWWNGAVQSEQEVPVVFKTSDHRVDALVDFLAGQHSYRTPGIVVHKPVEAHAPYAAWIDRETRTATP